MDTRRRKTFKKMKGAARREGRSDGSKRADSPLKIEAPRNVQKKIKKIVDDLMAILSLAKTSAGASRYLMYGKGGWPHEPTEPVASMERSGWPSHKP